MEMCGRSMNSLMFKVDNMDVGIQQAELYVASVS